MALTAIDYEELRNLFARLAWNLDHGNGEAYADDYTEDGSFEVLGLPADAGEHAGKHIGRAAVVHFVDILFAVTKGHIRHWNQNFVFRELAEGRVAIDSYLACIRVGEAPTSGVTLTAVYNDVLVKQDGRWLMQERRVHADPQPYHTETPTDVLVVRRDEFVAAAAR